MTDSTAANQAEFREIDVDYIAFSNSTAQAERRKHFDETSLKELVESIKKDGVVQPIVVRPRPKREDDEQGYELVAGERRLVAARKVGLTTVPAMVRVLDDGQALDVQLVENLQREGLHELVEAEGYEDLRRRGHSIEEIAKRVGKSASYVYKRIELSACSPAVREAFFDGKIDASRALLLSRIKPEESQAQALKDLTEDGWQGPMSYRQALEHVRRNFMLRLDQAPFKTEDATLYPDAGPCGKCPKNSARQTGLFGDVSKTALCTDSACFQLKATASVERVLAAAAEKGQTVIDGAAAKKILQGSHVTESSGYVALDERDWRDSKNRTFRQLAGKGAKPILVVGEDSRIVEVLKRDEVIKLAKERGVKVESPKSAAANPSQNEERKKVQAETAARRAIYAAVRPKLAKVLTRRDLEVIAEKLLRDGGHEMNEELRALWEPDSKSGDAWSWERKFVKTIPELDAGELTRLILDCCIVGELKAHSYGSGKPETLLTYAKATKVDPVAIRKALAVAKKAGVTPAAKKGKKA